VSKNRPEKINLFHAVFTVIIIITTIICKQCDVLHSYDIESQHYCLVGCDRHVQKFPHELLPPFIEYSTYF
jgi:hypothetical protein